LTRISKEHSQARLSSLVKAAFEAGHEDFMQLVAEATQLLSRESGEIGNLNVVGKLVEMKPSGQALIIGDLHGDLESLIQILQETDFLEELQNANNTFLIFMGDYGDRGTHSVEVYHVVLELKLLFPKQVIPIRGNHEGPEDLLPSPHDLPLQFHARFRGNETEAYAHVRKLFDQLYNAVLVEDRYLIVHGGLSHQIRTIQDLAYGGVSHPKQAFLEDLLWSDPDEAVKETAASPRGAGKLFGKKVTDKVLGRLGVDILIRGHEPCEEGFRINHSGKVLTLFSRRGPPYFNAYGAYLNVRLSERFENAEQLIPYIHKF
jgi:predicted phosphodiesterase